MRTVDAELAKELGGLGVAVKNLNENMRAMRAAQERMEERAEARAITADDARRVLRDRVEDLQDQVAKLDKKVDVELTSVGNRLDSVDATATAAKEAGDDYRRVVQQGKGVLLVVGFGGTSLGAALILFFESVVKWLKAQLGF